MTKDLTPYLLVVNAAKNRIHIQDFYMDGRLSRNVAHGYEARKQVLGELMNSGVVALDESRLTLGMLTTFNGLIEGLKEDQSKHGRSLICSRKNQGNLIQIPIC